MSQYKIGDKVDMREIVGEAICDLADANEQVWGVTSDCAGNMKSFIQKHADRFVDVGIAEQNAAGIAAGLALSGAVPYIMGMAPFTTMRAFEQNRTAIGYQNLPVRIIVYVAGMTTGGGSTHYAMEDIAIMRAINNMSVLSVSDPLLGAEAIKAGLTHDGPYYMRMPNGKGEPVLYEPGSVRFEIGKGITARQGGDITIIAHGAMVGLAIHVSDQLAEEGIGVRVIDMFTIKPLDTELLLQAVKETKRLVVWEDHYAYGGLSSAIADALVDAGVQAELFKRVAIPAVYPGFGSAEALYAKYGMDADTVSKEIRAILK